MSIYFKQIKIKTIYDHKLIYLRVLYLKRIVFKFLSLKTIIIIIQFKCFKT